LSDILAHVRWPVEWQALEDMQEVTSRIIRRRFTGDLADRGRFAAQELLENAVRYAIAGGEITVDVRESALGLELRVTNDAVASRMALLRKRIVEVSTGEPAVPYERALRRLIVGPTDPSAAAAGLGLLRVRHEADAQLELQTDHRRVTVIARAHYGLNRPPQA
jgi:hypothetical protein